MLKKLAIIAVCLVLLQTTFLPTISNAATFEKQTNSTKTVVAPGVTHILEKYESSHSKEVVNILDVDLNDTYTQLELALPDPLNSLKTTTSQAQQNNYEGHRVVGAINAGYFNGNGMPSNLIAKNNKIINYGILGENYESPTQQPVAFGITKTGRALADYYLTKNTFTINGESFPIHRINNTRGTNMNVLYTPQQAKTGTNQWGVEIVVINASKSLNELNFGDYFTGEVESISTYGSGGNSTIPSDGFVISIQDKELAQKLSSSVQPGMIIEVKIDIEDKWKDAEYILAAGPLLVKNGQVNLSMPTDSSFAKSKHPRTAVGIDATGTRVFLVTVDGRQNGYSNGTSLIDLAKLLIKKGAVAAINLDGGGSTTMAVRKPYTVNPVLANKPSEGYERRVSSTLQVVNTAPPGAVQKIYLSSIPNTLFVGDTIHLKVSNAFDQYLNPITFHQGEVKWTVEGNIGTVDGSTLHVTKVGSGKIIAELHGVRAEVNVSVMNLSDKPYLLDSFDDVSKWKVSTARSEAKIQNASSSEPFREGKSSLKLTYDFTKGEAGTKAAYVEAKTPITILSRPNHIGVWANSDGGSHWLRGVIIDGNGKSHTINFTEQGGFNWTGWKYVTATIPKDLPLPLKFEKIYIAQPVASLQNKGTVYFDKLQAVYDENYVEPLFNDLKKDFWAYDAIVNLTNRGLVKGYPNGTFGINHTITRAEAAVIMARAFNLKATSPVKFDDVADNHFAKNEIAAVAQAGMMEGMGNNKFSPNGPLTRAEIAAMLTRAYKLEGKANLNFKDNNPKHWANKYIQAVVANGLASGYPDNTFRPDASITRAEFATFMNNVYKKYGY